MFPKVSSRVSPEDAFLDAAEVPGAQLHLIDEELAPLDAELPYFIWVVVGVGVCPGVLICSHRHRRLWGRGPRFGQVAARGRRVAILSLRPLKWFSQSVSGRKKRADFNNSVKKTVKLTGCGTLGGSAEKHRSKMCF